MDAISKYIFFIVTEVFISFMKKGSDHFSFQTLP
jgi:hypothetical protein